MKPLVLVLLASTVGYLGLGGLAQAETFHVAQQAPGASDDNDGLSPVFLGDGHGPWETMEKGGEVAGTGDTVLVYDGDYRSEETGWGTGVIPIENSGSAGSPIRIRAAPGQSPLLNTILIHDKQWIEVRGLTFISPEFQLPANWLDMPEVVIDDPKIEIDPDEPWATREANVRLKYATYMAMRDFFLSVFTNGIDVKNSSNLVLEDNQIILYTFGIQLRGNSSDILVQNNTIHHCTDGIFTWQPSPSLSDSVVRNNVLRQNFNNGLMVREGADGVLIEGNNAQFNGTSHFSILGGVVNSTVSSNSGVFGGFYSETMEFPGSSAINVHTSGPGNVVDGNFAAYQIDWTLHGGDGYIVDLMVGGAGVVLENNIAYRNMGAGIRTTESPNCLIANNTLVENGYLSEDPRNGAGIALSQDEDLNQTIINNIFVDNSTAGIKSFEIIDQQLQIDYNLYHAAPGVPFIWDGYDFGDRAYFSLAEVQANTAWEDNGREGDPLFADPLNADFHLQLSSPAVEGGLTVPGVENDYDRVPRPQGAEYDIGAFEYCSGGCIPIFADGFEGGDTSAWSITVP